MRRLGLLLVTASVFGLAFLVILTVTGGDDDAAAPASISAIRSTAEGGLVVTFRGAPVACADYSVAFDGSTDPITARLVEDEIDGECPNVGEFRYLELPSVETIPDGFRDAATGGYLTVFDSSTLLVPDPLPPGWDTVVESGDRSGNWAVTYGTSTESVTVRQGPGASDSVPEIGDPEMVTLGATTATVRDQANRIFIYDIDGRPELTLGSLDYPREPFFALATDLVAG